MQIVCMNFARSKNRNGRTGGEMMRYGFMQRTMWIVFTAVFYTCGICTLMNKLGLSEYIPAMCAYDYDIAEMNNTKFTREFTLATGGPYCDCHYDHNK